MFTGALFMPGNYVSSMTTIVNYPDLGEIKFYDYLVVAYENPTTPFYAVFLTFFSGEFVLPANLGTPVSPNWFVYKKPGVGTPIKIFL
jgi:hypothetical protein